MRDNGTSKLMKETVKVFLYGQMDQSMKDIGDITKQMVKED